MPSLLVFSRDPGATNQLVAVLERLSGSAKEDSEGFAALRAAAAPLFHDLRIATRGAGESIWQAAGRKIYSWQGRDQQAAAALIAEHDAGLVLTGTSDIDEPGDRALWRAARAKGIASHAVLDHPANLARRFKDGDGEQAFPDWVYVPDSIFTQRLTEIGIPPERIRVTGDMHHARLRSLAAVVGKTEIESLRANWGGSPSATILLFASECGREMVQAGRSYPYDEFAVLTELLGQLAAGKLPDGRKCDPLSLLLVVRPHPRDMPGKYDELVAREGRGLKVIISEAGGPHVALLAADLVVGMNSSLLYEALELGRPAYSLTGHDLSLGKSRMG